MSARSAKRPRNDSDSVSKDEDAPKTTVVEENQETAPPTACQVILDMEDFQPKPVDTAETYVQILCKNSEGVVKEMMLVPRYLVKDGLIEELVRVSRSDRSDTQEKELYEDAEDSVAESLEYFRSLDPKSFYPSFVALVDMPRITHQFMIYVKGYSDD